MKTRVVIDVIYTKVIEVEVPDIKGTEDADILEQAVQEELDLLPDGIDNGFWYGWESWEEVER